MHLQLGFAIANVNFSKALLLATDRFISTVCASSFTI
jgi:hypothetical protein